MDFEEIDYINTAGDIRGHLRRVGTWGTLCGIAIDKGSRGCVRGYQFPAAGNGLCKSCERLAAFFKAREKAS